MSTRIYYLYYDAKSSARRKIRGLLQSLHGLFSRSDVGHDDGDDDEKSALIRNQVVPKPINPETSRWKRLPDIDVEAYDSDGVPDDAEGAKQLLVGRMRRLSIPGVTLDSLDALSQYLASYREAEKLDQLGWDLCHGADFFSRTIAMVMVEDLASKLSLATPYEHVYTGADASHRLAISDAFDGARRIVIHYVPGRALSKAMGLEDDKPEWYTGRPGQALRYFMDRKNPVDLTSLDCMPSLMSLLDMGSVYVRQALREGVYSVPMDAQIASYAGLWLRSFYRTSRQLQEFAITFAHDSKWGSVEYFAHFGTDPVPTMQRVAEDLTRNLLQGPWCQLSTFRGTRIPILFCGSLKDVHIDWHQNSSNDVFRATGHRFGVRLMTERRLEAGTLKPLADHPTSFKVEVAVLHDVEVTFDAIAVLVAILQVKRLFMINVCLFGCQWAQLIDHFFLRNGRRKCSMYGTEVTYERPKSTLITRGYYAAHPDGKWWGIVRDEPGGRRRINEEFSLVTPSVEDGKMLRRLIETPDMVDFMQKPRDDFY